MRFKGARCRFSQPRAAEISGVVFLEGRRAVDPGAREPLRLLDQSIERRDHRLAILGLDDRADPMLSGHVADQALLGGKNRQPVSSREHHHPARSVEIRMANPHAIGSRDDLPFLGATHIAIDHVDAPGGLPGPGMARSLQVPRDPCIGPPIERGSGPNTPDRLPPAGGRPRPSLPRSRRKSRPSMRPAAVLAAIWPPTWRARGMQVDGSGR